MKNMNVNRLMTAAIVLGAMTVTAGCGGGGGGASNAAAPVNPVPPAAAASSDAAVGTITGFGSIYLNGRKYETDNAEIYRDDDRSDQSDLDIGMVVKVKSDGVQARYVTYDEEIKGPLDAKAGETLTVLGQTVLVTPATRIDDGLTLNDFIVGDILEVSGYRNPDDEVEATYIERKAFNDVDEYEVVGHIRNLDDVAEEFMLGGLIVSYATARLDDIRQLENDLLVEVEDENRAYSPGDFKLFATKVEGMSPLSIDDDIDDDRNDDDGDFDDDFDDVEFEGFISEVIDANNFVLNGLQVFHDSGTRFIFGTADMLTRGTKVEVEGSLTNDVLTASKIKLSDNVARIDGLVENLNPLTVFGVVVLSNSRTEVEDDRDDMEPFGVDDLMINDFVEVEGNVTPEGVLASEIERDDDDDTRLRGVVTAFDADAGTLAILGVDIVTDSNTDYEADDDSSDDGDGDSDDDGSDGSDSDSDDSDESSSDDDIGAAEFFSRLEVGQTVVEAKWKGTITDRSLAVDELELEDED